MLSVYTAAPSLSCVFTRVHAALHAARSSARGCRIKQCTERQLLTHEAGRGVRLHVTLAGNIKAAHPAAGTLRLCSTDC